MDTYIINGVEIEYDTFDLVNMEVYRDELKRVAKLAELTKAVTADNYIEIIREMCEGVLDAFDTIIGEGTSELLFGGSLNAKTIPEAWQEFTTAVSEKMNAQGGSNAGNVVALNREQRRAAERAARREAAKERVEARMKSHEG